jgi:hypothetical protein
MPMRRGFLAIVIAALLAGAGVAWAQVYAPESLDRYFRLEWQATRGVKGAAIEGYVYNQAAHHAERMRLVIERLVPPLGLNPWQTLGLVLTACCAAELLRRNRRRSSAR